MRKATKGDECRLVQAWKGMQVIKVEKVKKKSVCGGVFRRLTIVD